MELVTTGFLLLFSLTTSITMLPVNASNATTSAPTTISSGNSTSAPTSVPPSNATTSAPTTISSGNSTSAPTSVPPSNATTSTPTTISSRNSTSAPTSVPPSNATTSAPTRISSGNSTSAPTSVPPSNATTSTPTTISSGNSTSAPTSVPPSNATTSAPTRISSGNSTSAPTSVPPSNATTSTPTTISSGNSTSAPLSAVRVETIFKVTNKAFSVQLLNESSTVFQSLQQTIKAELSSLFSSQISKIKVVQVRVGSVEATTEFDVVTNQVSNVNISLGAKIRSGVLGGLVLDKTIYSFKIKGKDCRLPNVTITNLAAFPNPPARIKRSEGYIAQTRVQMNCANVSSTSFSWVVWQLKPFDGDYVLVSSGLPAFVLDGTAEWNMEKQTFSYGLYLVQFRVSMSNDLGEIFFNSDLRLFEIIQSPIVAGILGGSHVKRGFNKNVKLEAKASYDPDVALGDLSGMTFTWLCKKKEERFPPISPATMPVVSAVGPKGKGGCFDTGIGKLASGESVVDIDTGSMLVDHSYTIKLIVSKATGREDSFEQTLDVVEGDPPQISISCRINCGPRVNPSSRIKVITSCITPLKTCGLQLRYKWSLRRLKKGRANSWIDVLNLNEKFSTPLNSPDAVIKQDVLDAEQRYQLTVQVEHPGVAPGISSRIFDTNSPPKRGRCHISPDSGTALETEFLFTCQDWEDSDQPLTYQFYYVTEPGLTSVISYGYDKQVKTKLPVGGENNHIITINVLIIDSLSAFTKTAINVKVEPIVPDSDKNINTAVDEASNEVDMLLQTGDVKGATQLANAALETMSNAKQGQIDENQKTQVVDRIISQMTSQVKVGNLQTLTQITSVIGRATANPDEVSLKAQDETIKSLKDMTNLLVEKSEDQSASEDNLVDASGENLALSLGNMMKSASKKANTNQEKYNVTQTTKSIKVTEDSVVLVNKVGESLLKRKVIGESPSVVRTSSLSMVLGRQTPKDVNAMKIEEGGSSFVLPSGNVLDTVLQRFKFIDSQMTITKFNPFTWDKSANLVDSNVSSLVLRNNQGSDIPMQQLAKDIQVSISRPLSPSSSNLSQESSFLKPTQVRSYRFFVDYLGKALELQIKTVQQASVKILVKHENKPSASSYDFMALLSSLPSCSALQIHKACRKKNGGIFLSSLLLEKTGVYYIGILLDTSASHARKKRSCFGNGRQKRSCVEPKDAPKPENQTIVPQYDPKTDMNYSLSTQQYVCLFWDGSKWTSSGCKAGSQSTSGTLHCLCNHLTSFGGSLLVTPNPIDLDVVFLELSRLDQTGNVAVLSTILTFLLIYLVIAVIARREDRRNTRKYGPPLPVDPEELGGGYHYEMTVTTGVWKNCGTTANVVIEIQGSQATSKGIVLSRDMEPSRIILANGNADTFIITLPESLGSIDYMNIWHDNTGSSPSWFLEQIVIKDKQRGTSWLFLHRNWFALEKGDGKINKVLLPTSPIQMKSFQYKFNYQTSKRFKEDHIWLSVLTKPPHSNFTRLQRATCCLSVLFSAMVVNAMFYKLDKTPDPGIQIGPLKFNSRQITVGVYSSLIVVPIGLLIIFMFQNSRPKNTVEKRLRNAGKKGKLYDLMCCRDCGSSKNKIERLVNDDHLSAIEANTLETFCDNVSETGTHDDATKTSTVGLQQASPLANDENMGVCLTLEEEKSTKNANGSQNADKNDTSFEITNLETDVSPKTQKSTIKCTTDKEDEESTSSTSKDADNQRESTQQDHVTSTSKGKDLISNLFFSKVNSTRDEFWLPHGFIYISWFMCFVTVLVSASVTFMYSLQWGKEVANRWLSSMLVSFTEDLFVVQPVKICITAVFMAVFLQSKNKGKETSNKLPEEPSKTATTRGRSKTHAEKRDMTFPEESELKKAKDYQVKEEKMFSFVREALLFVAFLALLTIVCYGNRSYHGYQMTKTVKEEFSNFSKLTTSDKYWKWINTQYAESAYAGRWYNTFSEPNEVYIGNKRSLLVGMPRIRQLRIEKDSCVLPKKARSISSTCYGQYSITKEEKHPLFLPGWIPFHNENGLQWANLSQLCPKPWRYSAASRDLWSWGYLHTYSGGGYNADLGYNNKTAHFVASPLRSKKWIDARTRALLLEMSIFNPSTNQLSAITLYYEAPPTSFGHPFQVVETIALYGTDSASYDFFLICKLLFIFLVMFYLAREAAKAFKMKKSYFQSLWNWFEIMQVLVAVSVVVCYVVKEKMLLEAVQHVKENPYLTVNFQPVLAWKNAEDGALSLAVFAATVKVLRMLRFNPQIIIFSASLKSARETLLVYSIILSVVMISFALVEWVALGSSMFQFSTILRAFYSQLLMSLGAKMHLNAMRNHLPILGPLLGFAYKALMTFLFLNFYISVLNDSYEEVNSSTNRNSKEFEMSDFMLDRLKEMIFRKSYDIKSKEVENDDFICSTNETTSDAAKPTRATPGKEVHPDSKLSSEACGVNEVKKRELPPRKNILKDPQTSAEGHDSKAVRQNTHRMRRRHKKQRHPCDGLEKTSNVNACEIQPIRTKVRQDTRRKENFHSEHTHPRNLDNKFLEMNRRTASLRRDDRKEDIELIQLLFLLLKHRLQKRPSMSEDVAEPGEDMEGYSSDWTSSSSLASDEHDMAEENSCETYLSDTEPKQSEEMWGSFTDLLKNLSERRTTIPDHLRFKNTLDSEYDVSSNTTKPPWRP